MNIFQLYAVWNAVAISIYSIAYFKNNNSIDSIFTWDMSHILYFDIGLAGLISEDAIKRADANSYNFFCSFHDCYKIKVFSFIRYSQFLRSLYLQMSWSVWVFPGLTPQKSPRELAYINNFTSLATFGCQWILWPIFRLATQTRMRHTRASTPEVRSRNAWPSKGRSTPEAGVQRRAGV